jgi:hypothetical protein
MNATTARILGDARFRYVHYRELSHLNQARVIARYPHNAPGAWAGDYFYPVKKNGELAPARRVLDR